MTISELCWFAGVAVVAPNLRIYKINSPNQSYCIHYERILRKHEHCYNKVPEVMYRSYVDILAKLLLVTRFPNLDRGCSRIAWNEIWYLSIG